jgi:hypothetical protein
VTHDQLSGLLSGFVGISVIVVGYFQIASVGYRGQWVLKLWAKRVLAALIGVQADTNHFPKLS